MKRHLLCSILKHNFVCLLMSVSAFSCIEPVIHRYFERLLDGQSFHLFRIKAHEEYSSNSHKANCHFRTDVAWFANISNEALLLLSHIILKPLHIICKKAFKKVHLSPCSPNMFGNFNAFTDRSSTYFKDDIFGICVNRTKYISVRAILPSVAYFTSK